MSDLEIFEGERGRRVIEGVRPSAALRFGEVVREYQRTHPDTIVRVQWGGSGRGLDGFRGIITVTWWPRGDP